MSGFDIGSSSNVAPFLLSQESISGCALSPLSSALRCSQNPSSAFVRAPHPTVLLILFSPLIAPVILLCTPQTHWPSNGMAGTLKNKDCIRTRTHTHRNGLTHTSGFSFKCLSLYTLPVHPHTHNSLFIPSKSGHARPQPPRPNGPMNRNMSSA